MDNEAINKMESNIVEDDEDTMAGVYTAWSKSFCVLFWFFFCLILFKTSVLLSVFRIHL